MVLLVSWLFGSLKINHKMIELWNTSMDTNVMESVFTFGDGRKPSTNILVRTGCRRPLTANFGARALSIGLIGNKRFEQEETLWKEV